MRPKATTINWLFYGDNFTVLGYVTLLALDMVPMPNAACVRTIKQTPKAGTPSEGAQGQLRI